MNGSVNYAYAASTQQQNMPTGAPSLISVIHTPESRLRYQQDVLERDRQASSLAAAGKVAESIGNSKMYQSGDSMSFHYPNGEGYQQSLVSGTSGSYNDTPTSVATNPTMLTQTTVTGTTTADLDAINWNLMDLGGANFDDMDMDFASLFDPANELSHMQAHAINGYPAPTTTVVFQVVAPTPLGSMIPHQQQHHPVTSTAGTPTTTIQSTDHNMVHNSYAQHSIQRDQI